MVRSVSPLVVSLVLTSLLSAQATLNVPSQYATIQAAILAAQNSDTVLVAPGNYAGPIDYMGKDITVMSSQGASVTGLVGSGSLRVVTFVSGESNAAILDGFTVTGGAGGILCQDSSPVIRNCRIVGNMVTTQGGDGGGILCTVGTGAAGSPTVEDCVISGNFAVGSGGGILCHVLSATGVSFMTVRRCEITSNAGGYSGTGGIGGLGFLSLSQGTCSPTVEDCTISYNSSAGAAGGLDMVGVTNALVSGSLIQQNTSSTMAGSAGGGARLAGQQVKLFNCVVSGNTSFTGAGVYATEGDQLLANCTIADNIGNSPGNGIFAGQNATVTVRNCNVWGNQGSQIGLIWANATINVAYSNIANGEFSSEPTNISIDPLFVDAGNGDYHVASSSPCVDAGSNTVLGLPVADIDGTPRIVNGTVDIGPDEVPATLLPGTMEDLDLYTWINTTGDPHAELAIATAGDLVSMRFVAQGGTFTGMSGLVAAQLFPTGSAPLPNPGFADIHISLSAPFTVIWGSLTPTSFPAAGLPSSGADLTTVVPVGLSGTSLRLQGFVQNPAASNGLYAATRAHDISFL